MNVRATIVTGSKTIFIKVSAMLPYRLGGVDVVVNDGRPFHWSKSANNRNARHSKLRWLDGFLVSITADVSLCCTKHSNEYAQI